MTAWRNVIFSGFVGACLFAGCTVTTGGSNFDGGVFDETGGTAGTTGGAAGTTGGNGTGGTTGPATTVLQCTADYVPPATPRCGDDRDACDRCLQTHHCETPYLECWGDSQCVALINAMMTCMVDQFDSQGQTDPVAASETCQQKATIAIWQPAAGTSQAKARALWAEIEGSIDCPEVCCALVTHH